MTIHKRLTSRPDTPKQTAPEILTRPSHRDWDSLIGLLLMISLTGLASISMIVDISVLTQAFRTTPPSPQDSQQQIAEQSITPNL